MWGEPPRRAGGTRHGGRPAYRARDVDGEAWESALRPKRCLLAVNRELRNIVASKLIPDWLPEQISGWPKVQYPDNESIRIFHGTIYRSFFIQTRGGLKKDVDGPFAAHAPLATCQRQRTVTGSDRGCHLDPEETR